MTAAARLARRVGALTLLALALAAPAARAQLSASADFQTASRYMWRGITRSETWVAQPALQASVIGLSAGVWSNWQVVGAWPDQISDLAPRHRGFSEVDLWAEAAEHNELADIAAGIVRYMYPASDSLALRTHADNTTELYAHLRLPRFPWIKPSLAAWVDVDHGRGAYFEASVLKGLPLFPMGAEANLDIGATAGFSTGRTRQGFSHLELTLGPSARLGPARFSLDAHTQVGFDGRSRLATRPPASRLQTAFFWVTLAMGYTWDSAP